MIMNKIHSIKNGSTTNDNGNTNTKFKTPTPKVKTPIARLFFYPNIFSISTKSTTFNHTSLDINQNSSNGENIKTIHYATNNSTGFSEFKLE